MKKFIFFFFITINLIASTYYVDATKGNDNNDGLTEATAWKTIAKVNNSSFQPGDEILFKRGDEWREMMKIDFSGAPNNPITIGAYGHGRKPIINGADLVKNWMDSNNDLIWEASFNSNPNIVFFGDVIGNYVSSKSELRNEKDWYWANNILYTYAASNPSLIFDEIEASERQYGILSFAEQYIIIRGLEIRYTDRHGIGFMNKQPNGNVLIDSVDVIGCYNVGFLFFNGHENNIIQNSFSEFCGSAFYSNDANNITYRNNVAKNQFRRTYGDVNTDGHGFGCQESNGNLFEYNYAQNCNGGFVVDQNFIDGYGVTYRYNKSMDSDRANYGFNISRIGNNALVKIYYNISINNGYNNSNLFIGENKGTINIFNNTFYNDRSIGEYDLIRMYGISDGVNFKNNICMTKRISSNGFSVYDITKKSTLDSDNNLFYAPNLGKPFEEVDTKYADLISFQSAEGLDLHSIEADPLFIDPGSDLNLREDSPSINAGVDVGLKKDILGNSIVGKPDIGAYEFQPQTVSEITIEGNTGQGSTTLNWRDGTNKTIKSDPDGIFTITVPYNWSGTIIPSKSGYTFDPEYREFSNITSNYTTQDFRALPKGFSIQGNTGQGNTTLNWQDETNKTIKSDPDGNFTITVPYNWSGSITPSKSGYTFYPINREYKNIISDYSNQNFRILNRGVSLILKTNLSGDYETTKMERGFIPQDHPFNKEPWDYPGTETIDTISSDIIDWILVELRPDSSTTSVKKAAILKSNRFVYSFEGDSILFFPEILEGDYFITIYHRNHIPIMSATKIGLNKLPTTYDFTESQTKAYGRNSMQKLSDGTFGLISGDGNGDGAVNDLDYETVAQNIFKSGYSNEDLDMSGIINVLDYSQVYKNLGKTSHVPKIIQK